MLATFCRIHRPHFRPAGADGQCLILDLAGLSEFALGPICLVSLTSGAVADAFARAGFADRLLSVRPSRHQVPGGHDLIIWVWLVGPIFWIGLLSAGDGVEAGTVAICRRDTPCGQFAARRGDRARVAPPRISEMAGQSEAH